MFRKELKVNIRTEDEKFETICETTFDDIEDLVSHIKTAPVSTLFQGHNLSSESHTSSDDDFYDCRTFSEAVNKLEFGCDDYFEEFKTRFKKAKEIISKHKVNRQGKFKKDIMGFVPIVPNAIIGIPENMINKNIIKKSVPTLKIYLNISEHCGVSTQTIIKYRTITFALIDLLEQNGIRCEVWIIEESYEDEEIAIYRVKIKDYMQPINIYKIQFAVISPDMLRRIFFRVMETDTQLTNHDFTWSYGNVLTNVVSQEQLRKINGFDDKVICIPNTNQIRLNESIEKVMEQIIDKSGLSEYIKIDMGKD